MENIWLNNLKQFVEKKPIVVLKFEGEEWTRLLESRRSVNEFTVARPHDILKSVRPPTPCLIMGKNDDGEDLYFGLISSRSAVTTLESRIKIKRGIKIHPQSKANLLLLVREKPYSKNLKERLCKKSSVITLSPKLSSHIIEKLASIRANHGAMISIAESLSVPKYFNDPKSLQSDALRTALRAFGIASNSQAQSLELAEGCETALARIDIMEDSVIEHDARHMVGYNLMQSDLTGHAVFMRDNERLDIFTANRRPLERVFGVDLIYLNVSRQNIVMLQYKMLDNVQINSDGDTDWIYRPDAKLEEEIRRMQKFAISHPSGPHEYRLNPDVFYLKFVKRDGSITNGGILMPINHYEMLLTDPVCRGPKKGLRISYESLSGRYLREMAFLDLLRSGYIGAHAETTDHLKTLIDAVLKNDRAVVAAIQQQMADTT